MRITGGQGEVGMGSAQRRTDSTPMSPAHPPNTDVPARPGGQPPGGRGKTLSGLRPGGWLHSVTVFLTTPPLRASVVRNPSTPFHQPEIKIKIKVKVKTSPRLRRQQQCGSDQAVVRMQKMAQVTGHG
jgi:hypothetical protein